MPLESGDFIPDLNENNPLGSDPKSEGDDHLRLIKRTVLGSFPAFVGTTAVPKSVSLTEDQISDAALKSEAQTIDGAWTYTGVQKFTNPTSGPNSSLNVEGTVPGVLWHETDAAADERDWRLQANAEEFTINTRNDAGNGGATAMRIKRTLTVVDGIEHIIGGVNVAEVVTRDLGALLIEPVSGTRRKVGFRNPAFISLANADHTATIENEAQVLSFSGTGNTIILPNLSVGTTISIINRAGGDNFVEAGATLALQWLDGLGGPSAIPGTVTVAQGSIVTVYQIFSNQWEIWGNGISN